MIRYASLLALAVMFAPRISLAQKPPPDDSAPASPDDAAAQPDDVPAEPAAEAPAIGVDALRAEYLRLRDELFRSRARAATVASVLYSTKLAIYLNYKSGRFYTVTRASIRLDGAGIYDDSQGAIANNVATRFSGFVAPGRHKLTVRIEAVGKDDERFATSVENTFSFQAPAGRDVIIIANVKDDGDIAYTWKKKQSGNYKLRVDLDIKTAKRGSKKKRRGARKTNKRVRTAHK